MTDTTFKALVAEENQEKEFILTIQDRSISDLPEGDLLIRVSYSSLNYKDALSASGNRGVTRSYPHTPGIDAAGIVIKSGTEAFRPDDSVIVTSYDLGMNTDGGFGQYIRVPSDWAVRLPDTLSLKQSMVYGTAGFTAGMCVSALTHTVKPEDGDILITGATGGVGSLATAILAKLGYSVTGVTGKASGEAFLKLLGAKSTISRQEATDSGKRPILKGLWAGVVDTVGGDILATAIKSTKPWGTITCCGNVASPEVPMTVFPFILRGVKLLGIDSQNCPMALRKRIWDQLSDEWLPNLPETASREIGLGELDENIRLILKGQLKGRVVINLNG